MSSVYRYRSHRFSSPAGTEQMVCDYCGLRTTYATLQSNKRELISDCHLELRTAATELARNEVPLPGATP